MSCGVSERPFAGNPEGYVSRQAAGEALREIASRIEEGTGSTRLVKVYVQIFYADREAVEKRRAQLAAKGKTTA